jgi:hypothetical protein
LHNNIIEKYYIPFKKEEETLDQTVKRIDNKIINDRFKYICNRDIISIEDFDGNKRMD